MSVPATPGRLSNEDFRKILSTPRAAEPATPSRFAKYDPNYVPEFKKPEAPSSEKKKRKFHPKKTEEKKMEASGYVDLAALRREGKLADHDEEHESIGHLSSFISPEELKNLSESERRALEIERSKYLGGSEATTHLVKGLDYALLAKVKEDLAKKEREAEQQQRAEKAAAAERAGKFSKVISTEGQAHEIEAIQEFKTFIGKSVYEAISRKNPETVDHFLPGRMSFVFDLDPDSITDIPTIVRRSKDDLPVGRELMTSAVHPELMSKITAIMVYLHQGAKAYKKLKKKEKKEREEKLLQQKKQNAAQGDMDIDENIYDTDMTGVYIPKITPLADDERFDSRLSSSSISQARKQEEDDMARLARLTAQQDDGYAEAYPSTFEGLSFAAIDDDDDDDEGDALMKIDTRQNLKRHEFESDEAWIAHQSQREATPKAAFQFGVKKKDGRDKKAYSEEKLRKQLRQVEEIIERKQGKKIGGFEDIDGGREEKKPPKTPRRQAEDPYRTPEVDTSSYEYRLAQKRKGRESQEEQGASKKPRIDLPY